MRGYSNMGQGTDAPGPRPERELSSLAFLLIRDFSVGIMPWRSRDDGFTISLKTGDKRVRTWLTRLLAYGQESRRTIEDVYSDFMRENARVICHHGERYFEIRRGEKQEGLPDIGLVPLPNWRVLSLPRAFVQIVPRAKRARGPMFVPIRKPSLWKIRLPRELGTARSQPRLIEDLGKISQTIPDFALSRTMGKEVPGFDLGVLRSMSDAQLERLLRNWGTLPSLRLINGTTEYYWVERTLAFRYAQARFREQLLLDLNVLMKRIGLDVEIATNGLPSSAEIRILRTKLRRGDTDFKAAIAASELP